MPLICFCIGRLHHLETVMQRSRTINNVPKMVILLGNVIDMLKKHYTYPRKLWDFSHLRKTQSSEHSSNMLPHNTIKCDTLTHVESFWIQSMESTAMNLGLTKYGYTWYVHIWWVSQYQGFVYTRASNVSAHANWMSRKFLHNQDAKEDTEVEHGQQHGAPGQRVPINLHKIYSLNRDESDTCEQYVKSMKCNWGTLEQLTNNETYVYLTTHRDLHYFADICQRASVCCQHMFLIMPVLSNMPHSPHFGVDSII